MHEYAVKLELKEGVTQTQQSELQENEAKYNRLMNDLTEIKKLKKQQADELAMRKQETAARMITINAANE
jgi:hypothetical protein